MRHINYKYRIKSVDGKFITQLDSLHSLPDEVLDYIYRFICNVFQATSYLQMTRFYIPFRNSYFITIIRKCDALDMYTIDVTEKDAVGIYD